MPIPLLKYYRDPPGDEPNLVALQHLRPAASAGTVQDDYHRRSGDRAVHLVTIAGWGGWTDPA